MVSKKLSSLNFSKDFIELLIAFHRKKVKYMVIGGQAVIYYGHVRLTGDIDIFYDNSAENVTKLFNALMEFWAGDIPGITSKEQLMEPNLIVQFGVPPNRIDLLNTIEKIAFQEAWKNRQITQITDVRNEIEVNFIGLNELIKNKEAVNRPRDLEDIKFLKTLLQHKKGKSKN